MTDVAGLQNIKANVKSMIDQGRSDADIDGYLNSQGVTVKDLQLSPTLSGTGSALLAGAGRGASMDTADEIGAAIRGIQAKLDGGDYQTAYNDALKLARDNEKFLQSQHPYATATGQVLGGLLLAAATRKMPGMTPAATLGGRVAQSGLIGAGTGGAYGFGGGEGGFVNRVENAVPAAVFGGAVGTALPLVAAGASSLYNISKNALGVTSPEERALPLIANAASRDNITPTEIAAAVNAGRAKGVPLTPADLGPNLTRLGRTVETIPGEGSATATEFLAERQAGQGNRLVTQVKNYIADPEEFYKSIDDLDATRRAAAGPLYEAAYAKPAVEQWTPEIAALMKRPSMKAAYAKAAKIAAEEGRDPKELGLSFNEAGDPVFLAGADSSGKIPSTQTMDYIKRGLDDVVEQYRDKTTGKLVLDTEGNAINKTRAAFVDMLRSGNPDYAKALDSWQGPSHALDVLNKARDWASGDIEISQKLFNQMTPADQELTRLGVARQLKKLIDSGDDGVNKVRRIFGSQNKRDFLQILFPDATSWEKFSAIMGAENQIAKNAQIIGGGSPTARIQAEQGDASNALMERFVTSGSRGAGMELVRRAFQGARGLDDKTSLAIAQRLFSTDPQAASQLARELSATSLKQSNKITIGQQRIIDTLTGINSVTAPALPKPGDQSSLAVPSKTEMYAQALGAKNVPSPYARALT